MKRAIGRITVFAMLLAGCTGPSSANFPSAPDAPQATVTFYRPAGAGPFPGVVLLHHCGGIRGVVPEWRRRLVEWGYVVAQPDSFTPRGYPGGVCADGSKVVPSTRAADAYRALGAMEARGDVIPSRIAVMGHSHGGMATLATASAAMARVARKTTGVEGRFRAAVAFYPWCGDPSVFTYGNGQTYRTEAPLLILAGEKDDWTPTPPCQALAEGAKNSGQPVEITVYPGAHHSFDGTAPLTRVPHALRGKGATVAGDPHARKASIEATREFLAKHLGP